MSTRRSLIDAVMNNDLLTVNSLIQSGDCDVNILGRWGKSPLHRAVEEGNIEIVRCLMENTTCNVNIQDNRGNTPLHVAVQWGDIDIVRYLMEHPTCDVNIQGSRGYTPLHTAVEDCNIEIVKCIIENSTCDVNIQNNSDYTPLHIAVKKGNIEIVRYLIENTTCDVNIQDSRGYTPLHIAVEKGNIEFVRCLTENSTYDVNIQDSLGYTPLHIAVEKGNIEFVRCLIEHTTCNVNTCIQDMRGNTTLHIAVQEGNIEIVRDLIKNTTCNVNIQDMRGNTTLHIAVEKGNIESVRLLIEHTTRDLNIKNLAGYSPFATTNGLKTLQRIAKCQNVELCHVLIQHNVDVLTNHADNQLQLVQFILSENDFQSLFFFVQNGLYINSLTSSGKNIFHLLAQFYIEYLYIDFSFLFDYGLDFNLINIGGNSPLMVASLLNNLPVIQFLASLPCDINIQNHQGHTALYLCVIGFTLIKDKLNLKEIDFMVKMFCAHAYYPRYLKCIDTLLNLGADVNIQDRGGKTVLMLACMKNDRKLLETLLIHGADVNIVDSHGRSALQYIDLTNNVYDLTCFNLLLSHGCRQSFNQPCLNGNTIIQNVLEFSPLWQIDQIVNFIKFLVFNNVNLQFLTSDDGEISYGQLSLEEFSSESRHELRQILYLSGGSFVQITQIFHFEVEENNEASFPETLRENARGKFYLFANNLSLKEICRRVIRQNTGLAIHDRISELIDSSTLTNFLMFTNIDSSRLTPPVQLDSFIDDDYDDDYGSYDLNKEIEDYSMYEDCKYLNLNYRSGGDSPLHRAVHEGNITIVRCLIENTTININKHDSRGYTPLYIAVEEGNIDIVRCLIKHTTCDINIHDSGGYAPLHKAVKKGYIEIVRCLTENPNCDVNILSRHPFFDIEGSTPLHLAVRKGEIEIVRCLIEKSACNVTIKDNLGYTPLHIAVDVGNTALCSNDLKTARCLLERTECDVNIPDSDGNTPLDLAIVKSNIPIVCCMLKHTTFDVNIQDSDGNTPLHIAVEKGNIDIVRCLIENTNCNVDIQNSEGETLLHRAVCKGYIEIVRCLLENTACNVNIQDSEGYTPLHAAVKWGNQTIIENTICDVVIKRAVQKGDIIVRCLIENSICDVNKLNSEGNTPLYTAVQGGNVSILRCLIKHTTCEVNIRDNRGNTIIQNILKFPPLWQIDNVVKFIKFLVFKNVNLQHLTSDDRESFYGQLSLEEFSSKSRHELRQILYLSGGSFEQITQILHFKAEENYEASLPETSRETPREKFYLFANNLGLEKHCRRVVRQNTGLTIHDRFSKLDFPILINFLMFKDIDSEPFLLPDDDIFQIQNHIPPL